MRSVLLLTLGLSLAAAAPAVRKVVLVGDLADKELNRAFTVVADEALQNARFLPVKFEFAVYRPDQLEKFRDAEAVVVAGEPAEVLEIVKAFSGSNTPVLSVSSTDDAFRTDCRGNLFHVGPSQRMLDDAVTQWKKANPEAKDVEARAWHADFVKFSARQLNDRWKEKHGSEMTDRTWGLWSGVKLVTDAMAYNPEASPAQLTAYLRDEMEFDSYKGVYSTFRETGQLRQTLLVVVDGKLAGEAPVRGVAGTDELDSLGLQECK